MGGGKIEARGGGGGRRAGSAVGWSSSDNPHRLADQSVEKRQRADGWSPTGVQLVRTRTDVGGGGKRQKTRQLDVAVNLH